MYAFPTLHQNGITGYIPPESSGMTLRDYFAAKVIQGMYAAHQFPTGIMEHSAKEAYQMADAMMEARNAAQ